MFKFYTGVGTADFKNVLWIIGDAVHRLVYTGTGDEEHEGRDSRGPRRSLSVEDELFLTLCKLRHNFPEDDLAARFMISQSTVSRIFRTWVLCISHSFQELDIWPSRVHVTEFMPDVFAEECPSTRVMVDATEFFY